MEFYLGMVVCNLGIYIVMLVFDGVFLEDFWEIV